MRINRLDIHNLRAIAEAVVEPEPGINLVTGDNGAGKTSLIEAISLLGYSRSFLGCNTNELIRFGEKSLSVFAKVGGTGENTDKLGFGYDQKRGKSTRCNDKNVRTDTLVSKMPLVVVSPKSFELIDGAAKERRKLVDWGVFHVKPEFRNAWRRYRKLLLQRNSALKQASRFADIAVWSEHLAVQAEVVDGLRDEYVKELLPLFFDNLKQLDFSREMSVEQKRGWSASSELIGQLEQSFDSDKRVGVTQKGAHRYELCFFLEGNRAKNLLSRGEKKRILSALLLAQVELLAQLTQKKTLFLLDDLFSEFDDRAAGKLVSKVSELSEQSFITAIDEKVQLGRQIQARFHMKRGRLSRAD